MNNFTKHIANPVKKFGWGFKHHPNYVFFSMPKGRAFLSNGVKITLLMFLLITVLLIAQTYAGIEKEGMDAYNEKYGAGDYTIEIGDVLYISVWQEEDLREEAVVRPDGKISFPLAGDVPAYCLTFAQLRENISKRLSEYIRDPIVSISLKKMGGKKVIVLGEVSGEGVYSVSGKRTILEAIALAGGFTVHAVPSSVILIRGGPQNPQGMRLDLSRAIKKTDMSQNIALQSEDMVYVPRKFIADVNYFVSQITGPISRTIWTWRALETLD